MLALLMLGCSARTAPLTYGASLATPVDKDLRVELVEHGTIPERLSPSPADLVLLYAGEHKGSLQTCGCPKRPRGSLSRLDAVADAVRAQGAPTLLLNGGHWLEESRDADGAPRPDLVLGNQFMAEGLLAGAWDALNVAPLDAVALGDVPEAARGKLPLVSANVKAPGVAPFLLVERGGKRVGITGIAGPTPTIGSVTVEDPVRAAGPVLEELARSVDVLVLLVHQAPEAARELARAHPELDVIVDTGLHRELLAPVRVKEAAWVFSHYQTMRLGELRLSLAPSKEGHARVRTALDRKIDLDPTVPGDPSLEQLQQAARSAMDSVQRQMYGSP